MATMLSAAKMQQQQQQQQQQQFPPEQDHHLKQDHVVHPSSWHPSEMEWNNPKIQDEAKMMETTQRTHCSVEDDHDDGINLSTGNSNNNEKDLLLLPHRPPSLLCVNAVIKIQKAARTFLKKKKQQQLKKEGTNEKKDETLTREEEEEAFAAVVSSSDCTDRQRRSRIFEITSLLKDHLDVRDRMYRFKTYKNCFVASEAIDYMIKSNIVSTRQEGVEFGRLLQIHLHLWHHVCNHHQFTDDYLFFKFTSSNDDDDEKGEGGGRMMMLSSSYDESRISDITMLDFVRSSIITSSCEEYSEDVSLLDPWGSSSSSSSKGKEERSNERKTDSSTINNVSKGNKIKTSSSSSSLQQSTVITSPNKEACGMKQKPPFKLPSKRLYTKNFRQLSAETNIAVIADSPVSQPVRRESALQMLDYDVSSLTFSYDDNTISSANTRRSCNIFNNGNNSSTADSSSGGRCRVAIDNTNNYTRKIEATMSSEFDVVADDSPIQPPKRRQSALSIPHNHQPTIMEDIPSSICNSSSRNDDDLHIKNTKTQTTSMRSELDNMLVVASGDSPIQPPKRRQSEAADTIDMTSYTSTSTGCKTTIDIQNDSRSSSSGNNNSRNWSGRNGIINNDDVGSKFFLQQQRFLASPPSSPPHNLKKKKNVTSLVEVVAPRQQNRAIDSPLSVPKRRVSDNDTVNT